MSEIIKKVEERELAHVVKVGEKYYYVDSVLSSLGYETAVFEYDIKKNDVSNWEADVYRIICKTEEEMEQRHNEIINHLENHLDPNYVPWKFTFEDYIRELEFQEEINRRK